MKTVVLDKQKNLVQWVSQATGINTFGVKVRLRGNDLHILCEGVECPQRWRTLSDLLKALQQTDLDALTDLNEQPSIYQVFVYGRKKAQKRPEWCHRVYLNQLDKHLEQVSQALLEDEEKSRLPGGAMIVSNESLARAGDPTAIARYLSETLSSLGVAVQVKVKKQKPNSSSSTEENRLWIFCQSSYTPDPSLIAEPIAQKLRFLKLSGYEDAVIASQVNGESTPDWLLRIDLTPPEAMLKEWARWGDIQAIARLLNEILSDSRVAVQASLKESTLHIFCKPAFDPLETAAAPDKTLCLAAILPQIEAIAPQGILATTIYGQKTGQKQPTWIDWHPLPAAAHPALAVPPLELANTGDEPAITFLLERLLNPDLDYRLQTGGIRVLLLKKSDLLHIMCDGPVCPNRQKVAKPVTLFVRQLKIPGLAGVRVYGRRSGNKQPFWNYGTDFEQRERLVSEPTPEFAATSAYVQELLNSESDEPVLRPDLTSEEVQTFVTGIAQDWGTTVRKILMGTQLFTEANHAPARNPEYQERRVALIWGTLGLLLTFQSDWVLGQIISRTTPPQTTVISASSKPPTAKTTQTERTAFFAGNRNTSSAFNASGFTQTEENQPRSKATATAILLAARSQSPSFNARQLDEQFALYRQRIAKKGSPPDVLIIGSSRALRGVDPTALTKALGTQGYPNKDVFNFGINGATAQVVDFILRHVLEPSELPKLILWADGARAFNSGRDDITFKAIAASEGYKQVLEKSTDTPNQASTSEQSNKGEKKGSGYQALNSWFNQSFSGISATYSQRDRLKSLLNQQLKSLPLMSNFKEAHNGTNKSSTDPTSNAEEDSSSLQAVDFDGFLPLSIRFNPATYYQKHSKVPGSYDNDYKSFQLEGDQDEALQAVLSFTESKKIQLIFVNMPLSIEYLDPIRKNYEQQFQQYMLHLAERPNFVYRDLSQLLLTANDLFSDPSHLNRYGAYEVSKKLANDPMIPWNGK
jgi:Protein of unknown function (DUF1574)